MEIESLELFLGPRAQIYLSKNSLCPYAYNEWKYLERYIENPKFYISNILIENAVRLFAIGGRNWLFIATVDRAKASAMFFSLIETAKKNGLEPFDYLSKRLETLAKAESVEDYEKLLPLKDSFKIYHYRLSLPNSID